MGGATFPVIEVVPTLMSHSAPRPEVGAVASGFSLTNRSCGSVGLVVFAPLCLLWPRPSLWRQVRCALNPESSPRDWSFARNPVLFPFSCAVVRAQLGILRVGTVGGEGGVAFQNMACETIFAPGLLKPVLQPWLLGPGGAVGED